MKTFLVSYVDGHGQKEVKLAAVVPNGEVYFFGRDALDGRPLQSWLKSMILELIKE